MRYRFKLYGRDLKMTGPDGRPFSTATIAHVARLTRMFEPLLNLDAVLLPLPADERSAVVFEREFEARHRSGGVRKHQRRGGRRGGVFERDAISSGAKNLCRKAL